MITSGSPDGVNYADEYKEKRVQAFTLLELLVCLGLLAVILALCSIVFVTSWRKFQNTAAVQDTQTSALFSLSRISQDFSGTTIDYVIYGNNQGFFSFPGCPTEPLINPMSVGPTGAYPAGFFAFPSQRDVNGNYACSTFTGQALWKSWIVYYLEKEGSITLPSDDSSNRVEQLIFKLNRAVVAMDLYPGPSAADFFNLENLKSLTNRQTIAHNIYSLQMRGRVVSDDLYSYKISIYTRKDYQEKANTFKAERIFSISDPLHH
ncbi:MAG: prepilin-type N-terminal cleavage/methylation domain-containing protein [Candidatus Xenobiia bacterium LiM19]